MSAPRLLRSSPSLSKFEKRLETSKKPESPASGAGKPATAKSESPAPPAATAPRPTLRTSEEGRLRVRHDPSVLQLRTALDARLPESDRSTQGTPQGPSDPEPATFGEATPSLDNPEGGDIADRDLDDPVLEDPARAAAYVVESGEELDARTQSYRFTELLEAHGDDPEWIQEFYGAMGTERAAELINTATSRDAGHSQDSAAEYGEAIGQSLTTLQEDGRLHQSDVDSLLQEMVTAEGIVGFSDFSLSRMFPDRVGYSDSGGRATTGMFATAAAEMAVGTLALPDGTPASPETQKLLAANATELMANLPNQDVVRTLYGLGEETADGGRDWSNLEQFFETATAGQRRHGFHSELVLGDVTTVLDKLGNNTLPSMSPSTAAEMRAAAFDGTLTGVRENQRHPGAYDFAGDADFKDALAHIFEKHPTELLEQLQTNNDLGEESLNNLTKFFELAMFTPPLGDDSHRALQRLPEAASGLLTQLMAEARDEQSPHAARLAGEILGTIDNASERASERIANDRAARDKFVDTVVGFAFDLLPAPGVSGALGDVGSGIIKRALGSFDGILKRETLDRLENLSAEEAKQLIAEELKSSDDLKVEYQQAVFRDLMFTVRDQIGAGAGPDEGSRARTFFENAYVFVDQQNEGRNGALE